ncbi:hypothetical protein BESB_066190 [Besnoitia besnoiti]|uniref:RRP12 HEAT domain-containing protein n=1 Tax=Besnoitia besnoiti TaxID=94643 RepID=A0A2A9MF61_BESBE|nr:hypothetical protein BESB_066190 [Besnoitia besnoiti]PFH34586.1 hypothetical protein BESB_066190 [Besnoitia besnoiti]
MGIQKAPSRGRGQKPAAVSSSSSSDDAVVAALLKERRVLQRTEELLRRRAQEAEAGRDDGESMVDTAGSQAKDEEDDFHLTAADGGEASSSLLLARCSPFDADAALECLDLLRQSVQAQSALAAGQGAEDGTSAIQTPVLSTALHTLVVCICREAAAGAEDPGNERTRRITTGLSLLFALLVEEGLPQAPLERHRAAHEDAALIDGLLRAIDAVSSSMKTGSPRPLLLLLHALRRIFLPPPAGKAEEEGRSACGCLPTRAVWTRLLYVLTEDPRASARWLSRQVALHLLRVAAEQVSSSSSPKKQKRARESLQTCMGVLDRWVRSLDFTVVTATAVPASTLLQRSLPFFHRCLPPLLDLESSQNAGAQSAASADKPAEPQQAAEGLCVRLAFLSRKAGRTPAAADALRCVAAVIRDLRRPRRCLGEAEKAPLADPQGRRRAEGGHGDAGSSASALSLTVQLLPALLQQQKRQGAQRGLWEELGGDKGKGSCPVPQGTIQYATAWVDAVAATTCALMHWAGEAREPWKAPEMDEAMGEEEKPEALKQDTESMDELLLLQQLKSLSLADDEGRTSLAKVVADSQTLCPPSSAAGTAASVRLSVCMQAVERVIRCFRRVLDTESDPSILSAVSVTGRRLIEASGSASVPAFPALASFCLSLLHFRHKRRLPEGLEATRALFAALEAVASKQFVECWLHPELDHFRRASGGGADKSVQSSKNTVQAYDGKCMPTFLRHFLEIYRPCFAPLLTQIVNMFAVVETGEAPEQGTGGKARDGEEKRKAEKKKSVEEVFGLNKDSRDSTRIQQQDLAPYRGHIRLCVSAALCAFKARTLLTDPHLLPVRSRASVSFSSVQQHGRLLQQCPITNAWALALLPRLLGRDELHFFSTHFLPLARELQQQTAEKAKRQPLEARELCRLSQQVWSLLPGFANHPVDLATGISANDFALMKNILQFLHDPVLREEICSAIRNLSEAAVATGAAEESSGEEEASAARGKSNKELGDDAEKAVMEALCTATSSCAKEAMQACGAHVMGFLVVRFLQVHKISLKKDGEETAGERALAAMLLGEKEDLEQLTQSAKMKAAQHLLGAIKAYAPLCPPDLLHANVRRFTTAFLRRANAAAGLPSDSPSAGSPAAMGVAECSALVDVADALHPFLPVSVGLEVFESLRQLVSVCSRGLLTSSNPAESQQTQDDRLVLRALLRRGYKALKHVLERSAACRAPSPEATEAVPSCVLGRQELESLWEDLVAARNVSCGTAAEKPRLGCLRAFVGCLTAAAHAAIQRQEESSSHAVWDNLLLERVFPAVVPEILLSLKDLNRLVRETALSSLSALCDACGGDQAKLTRLAVLIATGLGGTTGVAARGISGETPIMKTAAVLALSRVVFSYSDQMDESLIQQIADVVLVLLQDGDKQVFLAALRFARVIAQVVDTNTLERFLPAMLAVLRNKHALRAKMRIRRLIEKLLKNLGETAIRAAFPQEHLPLLRHLQRSVRKQQLRELLVNRALQEGLSWDELSFKHGAGEETEARGKKGKRKENDAFSKMMEEDEEDDEDDEDDASAAKKAALRKRRAESQAADDEENEDHEKSQKKTSPSLMQQLLDAFEEEDDSDDEGRRNKKRKRSRAAGDSANQNDVMLLEDSAGELPLDFYSPAAAHRVLLSQPLTKHRRRILSEGERSKVSNLTWNEEGRLVIPEEEDDEEDDKDAGFTIGKASSTPGGKRGLSITGKTPPLSSLAKKGGLQKEAGASRKNLSCLAARREAMKSAKQERRRGHFVQKSGDEFKAKKAKGDVKQNNKVEPFAYIRLNRVMLREKHRPQALQSLATLVKKKDKRRGGAKGKGNSSVKKNTNKRSRQIRR